MAENSKIGWTDHTFNPWVGCTKLSPACDNCYAEGWSKRAGRNVWGPHADRQKTKTWGHPIRWNRDAVTKGIRYRVFCASLADVFDNHRSIKQEWRDDLWRLIRQTPNLDWLLLTKRPHNIRKYLPADWGDEGYHNVWLGTTIENHEQLAIRAPTLAEIPAVVRFWSCEPLLEDIAYDDSPEINFPDWVIAGCESGHGARQISENAYLYLAYMCQSLGTSFFMKQLPGTGARPITDINQFPEELRVQQFPIPRQTLGRHTEAELRCLVEQGMAQTEYDNEMERRKNVEPD